MRTLASLVLGLAACIAQAADPQSRELSIGIGGELVIDAEGKVRSYRMDDGLAPVVADLVQRNVDSWRFEPILVDGKPVTARTRMRLALLAQPRADGGFLLRVEHVHFGDMKTRGKQTPPSYPRSAIEAGVEARVMITARIDEQGNVVDVHPYQTSLSRKGHEARYRRLFEKASMDALRSWKYEPGEEVGGVRAEGIVQVPFEYTLAQGASRGEMERNAKRWRAYIPGPVTPAPWADAQALAGLGDADLPEGLAASLDSRFRLKSEVVGKTL